MDILTRLALGLGAALFAASCSNVDSGFRTTADAPALTPDAPLPELDAHPPVADAAADARADASFACDGGVVGSNIQIEFDSLNAEWVKSLRWVDSSLALGPNLSAYGAGPSCSGPNEEWPRDPRPSGRCSNNVD